MQSPIPIGQNPSLPQPVQPQIVIYSVDQLRKATAGGVFSILARGGSPLLTLDDSTGALTLPFVGGGGSNVISVGAADSGGVGFRLLRVPN